jgi:hypothetical protein
MDEFSHFQVPVELFDHIDQVDSNNPEIFQHDLIEDCESQAVKVLERISYLDVRLNYYSNLIFSVFILFYF